MEDPDIVLLRHLLETAIEGCNDYYTLDLMYKILISDIIQ